MLVRRASSHCFHYLALTVTRPPSRRCVQRCDVTFVGETLPRSRGRGRAVCDDFLRRSSPCIGTPAAPPLHRADLELRAHDAWSGHCLRCTRISTPPTKCGALIIRRVRRHTKVHDARHRSLVGKQVRMVRFPANRTTACCR